jgi:hypothetical protein
MNREQAIEKAAEFYAKPRTFIGALEALGVLKLDAPAPAAPLGSVTQDQRLQAGG